MPRDTKTDFDEFDLSRLHRFDVTLSTDMHDIEDAAGFFDITGNVERTYHPDIWALEGECELFAVVLGGLRLDREQVVQMCGLEWVHKIEERAATEYVEAAQ